jgi:hypothetical protein
MLRLYNALCVACLLPGIMFAQGRDSTKVPLSKQLPSAVPACCAIVRIESEKLLVTARETATGFTFRFSVKNRRVLGTLKIGQPVWADFTAKTVKLKATDAQACCAIVETPPAPAALGADHGVHATEFRKEKL